MNKYVIIVIGEIGDRHWFRKGSGVGANVFTFCYQQTPNGANATEEYPIASNFAFGTALLSFTIELLANQTQSVYLAAIQRFDNSRKP